MKSLVEYVNEQRNVEEIDESFFGKIFGIGSDPTSIVTQLGQLFISLRKTNVNLSDYKLDDFKTSKIKYDGNSKMLIWTGDDNETYKLKKGQPFFKMKLDKALSKSEVQKYGEMILKQTPIGRTITKLLKDNKESQRRAIEYAEAAKKKPENIYRLNKGESGWKRAQSAMGSDKVYYQIKYNKEDYYFTSETTAKEASKLMGEKYSKHNL